MAIDVAVKQTEPVWIASVRAILPGYPAVGSLYPELFEFLHRQNIPAGVSLAIWHDPEFKESDVDGEAGVIIPQPVDPEGRIQVRQLPAELVASLIHAGAFNRLSESYSEVARWIRAHGYTPNGPAREIYLKLSQPVRMDDESYITEIQIPVQKSTS